MFGISAKADTPNITQAIAMSYFWDRKDRRLVFLLAIFLGSYIEISVDLNGDCRASLGANGLCQKELLYVVIRIPLRISLKRLESCWFGLPIGVEMIDGFVIIKPEVGLCLDSTVDFRDSIWYYLDFVQQTECCC